MLGSWKSSGINEAITDKSPTESCNIPQVQVPINEAKQFADACACVPIDKLNLAIQDESSSKECEQSDKINHDNIGRKDDCLFAPKSFDVNKCHTDQKHVGNVHGIQNEASKGASDKIKKYSKPPYSPKVMALINWAPSFDLGIDDDDQSNMQCQVNAIYQPKGPSEAEHINIEDDVPYVHNDHLEGNLLRRIPLSWYLLFRRDQLNS